MFHDNTPPGKRSPSPTKPSKRKSSTQEYGCEGICDHSQESIYHFTQPPDQIKPESIEPRKKKKLFTFHYTLYWLFNRDPYYFMAYIGLL